VPEPENNEAFRQRKVVVLDEADSLTPDSQSYLRHMLEGASSTRFILICNFVDKMHDALRSRCCMVHFPKLPDEAVLGVVARVVEAEGLLVDADALGVLIDASDGDMRRALMLLQTAGNYSKAVPGSDRIGIAHVCRAAGSPTPGAVDEFLGRIGGASLAEACALTIDFQRSHHCPLPDVLWALYTRLKEPTGPLSETETGSIAKNDKWTARLALAESESMILGSEDVCVLAHVASTIWSVLRHRIVTSSIV
jgi:DNA polymerase III delta prime subunit